MRFVPALVLSGCISFAPVKQHVSGTLEGACIPSTCDVGYCGVFNDGCGGALDCGGCVAPATCGGGGEENRCGTAATMMMMDPVVPADPVDAGISASFMPTSLVAGNALAATITISAVASNSTAGGSVAVTLPASYLSVTWTCTPSGGATATPPNGNGAPSFSVSLPGGSSVVCSLNGTVNAGAATASESLTATVSATGDGNAANNIAQASVSITAVPPPPAPVIGSVDSIAQTGTPSGACDNATPPEWTNTSPEIRQGAGAVKIALIGTNMQNATGASIAISTGTTDASHATLPVACLRVVDATHAVVYASVPHGVRRTMTTTAPIYTVTLNALGGGTSNASGGITITPITVSANAFGNATQAGTPSNPYRNFTYALTRAGTDDTIDLISTGSPAIFDPGSGETYPTCSASHGGASCNTYNVDSLGSLTIRSPQVRSVLRGRDADALDCDVGASNAALVVRNTALILQNVEFRAFGTRAIDFTSATTADALNVSESAFSKICGHGIRTVGPAQTTIGGYGPSYGSGTLSFSQIGESKNGADSPSGFGSSAIEAYHLAGGQGAILFVVASANFSDNETGISVSGNLYASISGDLTFTNHRTAIDAGNTAADTSAVPALELNSICGNTININGSTTWGINTGVRTRIAHTLFSAGPYSAASMSHIRIYGTPTVRVEWSSMVLISPGSCSPGPVTRVARGFEASSTPGVVTLSHTPFSYEYGASTCVENDSPAVGSYPGDSGDLRWMLTGPTGTVVVVNDQDPCALN